MHTYALITAHIGLTIHSTALAALWSIILGATIVGVSVSAVRILHGVRHVHVDLMRAAQRRTGPCHTFHAHGALQYQPTSVVSA